MNSVTAYGNFANPPQVGQVIVCKFGPSKRGAFGIKQPLSGKGAVFTSDVSPLSPDMRLVTAILQTEDDAPEAILSWEIYQWAPATS